MEENQPEIAATVRILERYLGSTDWRLAPSREGRKVGTYVARSGNQAVFVKWDVPGHALNRLSELGIVPPVLLVGQRESRPFVIQKYVDAQHPERTWFGHHTGLLAKVISAYQQDAVLTGILSADVEARGRQPVRRALAEINEDLALPASAAFQSRPITDSRALWRHQAVDIQPMCSVPVHLDPNSKNWLLCDNQVFLIDWDEATLSDPMRDIGPLLWWYVPRSSWHKFFTDYGMEMTDDVVHRLYWWVAQRSIAVALWLAKQGGSESDIEDFLGDFIAAVAHADNPR